MVTATENTTIEDTEYTHHAPRAKLALQEEVDAVEVGELPLEQLLARQRLVLVVIAL